MWCSQSTCLMRALIYQPSTHCCCFDPLIARHSFFSNLVEGCVDLMEKRSARSSTLSDIIARSSGLIDDFEHYWEGPARIWSSKSSKDFLFCRPVVISN